MDDGPYWVILLMYGSHDMRHTSFLRLTVVNGTPGFWGFTHEVPHVGIHGEFRSKESNTTTAMRIIDDIIHVVFLIAGQSNNMNFITCTYVLSNILCS